MNSKKISKLLKGVLENLLETIESDEIKGIITSQSYITGGCIPSMLLGEFVSDFDIYFKDRESADKVKNYYSGIKKDKNKKFHVNLITDNSINLSDKIQLITKFVGEPKKIIKSFDWEHLQSFYEYPDNLNIPDKVYKLLLEKKLIYTGSAFPLSSLIRLKKYLKKNWDVSALTIMHIALDFAKSIDMKQTENIENDVFIKKNNSVLIEDEDYNYEDKRVSVENLIYHLNGVDPIVIQDKLLKHTGEYLEINEIVKIMLGE